MCTLSLPFLIGTSSEFFLQCIPGSVQQPKWSLLFESKSVCKDKATMFNTEKWSASEEKIGIQKQGAFLMILSKTLELAITTYRTITIIVY